MSETCRILVLTTGYCKVISGSELHLADVQQVLACQTFVSWRIHNCPTSSAPACRAQFVPKRERGSGSRLPDDCFCRILRYCERSRLSSFLNFLRSPERTHPIDAGPTVTCLVPLDISPQLGTRFPSFSRGKSLFAHGRPALVHEDRSIADSCLCRHPCLESCDHDRPTGIGGGTRSFLLGASSSDGRM